MNKRELYFELVDDELLLDFSVFPFELVVTYLLV